MASENPYQAPATDLSAPAVGVLSGRREDLRSIAIYQRGLIACIGMYLVTLILLVAIPAIGGEAMPAILSMVVTGVMIVTGIVGAVFVILLAMKTDGIIFGLILGVATIFPCLGLIILASINGRATRTLKRNGISVGFFGARMSDFDHFSAQSPFADR